MGCFCFYASGEGSPTALIFWIFIAVLNFLVAFLVTIEYLLLAICQVPLLVQFLLHLPKICFGNQPLPPPLRRKPTVPTLRNVESTAGIHSLATDTSGSRPRIQRFSYGEAAKLRGFGHGDVWWIFWNDSSWLIDIGKHFFDFLGMMFSTFKDFQRIYY